jgi:hypothetical protein
MKSFPSAKRDKPSRRNLGNILIRCNRKISQNLIDSLVLIILLVLSRNGLTIAEEFSL